VVCWFFLCESPGGSSAVFGGWGWLKKLGAKRGAPPLETAMLPLIVCVSRGCVSVNISHKICARREAARPHRDGVFHAIPVCVLRRMCSFSFPVLNYDWFIVTHAWIVQIVRESKRRSHFLPNLYTVRLLGRTDWKYSRLMS